MPVAINKFNPLAMTLQNCTDDIILSVAANHSSNGSSVQVSFVIS